MIGAMSSAKVGFSLIRAAGLQACTITTKTTKNLFIKTMAANHANFANPLAQSGVHYTAAAPIMVGRTDRPLKIALPEMQAEIRRCRGSVVQKPNILLP